MRIELKINKFNHKLNIGINTISSGLFDFRICLGKPRKIECQFTLTVWRLGIFAHYHYKLK